MKPPPPSDALVAAIGQMKPVATRVPARTLALVVGVWGLYLGVSLAMTRLRPDLPFLPAAWVVVVGCVWLAGALAPLAMALLPRRGQVLSDGNRALVTAALAALGLIAVSAAFAQEAPGHSLSFPRLIGARGCLTFALGFAVAPSVVGVLALRRAVGSGGWRVGAALGAAAGALGGLALHFLCPIAAASHVALAHGGAVVICALLGALLTRPIFR